MWLEEKTPFVYHNVNQIKNDAFGLFWFKLFGCLIFFFLCSTIRAIGKKNSIHLLFKTTKSEKYWFNKLFIFKYNFFHHFLVLFFWCYFVGIFLFRSWILNFEIFNFILIIKFEFIEYCLLFLMVGLNWFKI